MGIVLKWKVRKDLYLCSLVVVADFVEDQPPLKSSNSTHT
jgi:hypothetical protein